MKKSNSQCSDADRVISRPEMTVSSIDACCRNLREAVSAYELAVQAGTLDAHSDQASDDARYGQAKAALESAIQEAAECRARSTHELSVKAAAIADSLLVCPEDAELSYDVLQDLAADIAAGPRPSGCRTDRLGGCPQYRVPSFGRSARAALYNDAGIRFLFARLHPSLQADRWRMPCASFCLPQCHCLRRRPSPSRNASLLIPRRLQSNPWRSGDDRVPGRGR